MLCDLGTRYQSKLFNPDFLRHERCAGIAFIERPFMGRTSCLLVFLNADGGIMFKVFVGRDESGELKADQLEKFRALRDRICA
jgi:heme iron utilization protein